MSPLPCQCCLEDPVMPRQTCECVWSSHFTFAQHFGMVIGGLAGGVQAQIELTLQEGLNGGAGNFVDQLIHSDLPTMSPQIPATVNRPQRDYQVE